MTPMTEREVLRALQSDIAALDLDHPHAVEFAIGLGVAFSNQARRAHDEATSRGLGAGQIALQAIADDFSEAIQHTVDARENAYLQSQWDKRSPEERQAVADQLAQAIAELEAEKIQNAHVAPFFCPAIEQVQRRPL